MAISSWHKILSTFVLLQLLFESTKAFEEVIQTTDTVLLDTTTTLKNYITQDNQLSGATVLEDYIVQCEEKYQAQIDSYGKRLNEVHGGFDRLLGIVNIQRDQTEASLVEIERHFELLALQNDLNNHCVQKYRNILVPVNTLRQGVNHCVNSAAAFTTLILTSGQSRLSSLIDYLNSNLRNDLSDCQRIHSNSDTNHANCVTQQIATTNTYFHNSQNEFDADMDTARFWIDYRSRQATECSSKPTLDALSSIGEASRLIDDCIASVEPGCPNVVHYAGLSNSGSTANCLLINFMSN